MSQVPTQKLIIALRPSNYVYACCQNGNWGTETKVKSQSRRRHHRSLAALPAYCHQPLLQSPLPVSRWISLQCPHRHRSVSRLAEYKSFFFNGREFKWVRAPSTTAVINGRRELSKHTPRHLQSNLIFPNALDVVETGSIVYLPSGL